MKKLYLMAMSLMLIAMTYSVYGQGAKRYPLFEHFTNASCSPCYTHNPVFHELYANNENRVNHITYHTYWPGYDPMHLANVPEQNAMVAIYSVPGVPQLYLNGSTNLKVPSNATQAQIDAFESQTSPIQLNVEDVSVGTDRTATVTFRSVLTPPTGNFILRVAVIESLIEFATPPGTNRETYFPNVFRDMLTSTAGEQIVLQPQGTPTSLSFTYTPDPNWNMDNIYVIAYIQNTATGEVINSAASNMSTLEIAPATATILKAAAQNTFSVDITETDADKMIQVTLDSKHPMDWAASLEIDGTSYTTDTVTFMSSVSTVQKLNLKVSPGSTIGLGTYKITIGQANSNTRRQTFDFVVVSGVTDLIINVGDAKEYENIYTYGIQAAGNLTSATMSEAKLAEGITSNALDGITNIYMNAGKNADALNDGNIQALQSFLQNGGRLFLSGQDVGYGAMSSASVSSTPMVKSFFSSVLKGTFFDDGDFLNRLLTPVSSDTIFGNMSSVSVVAARFKYSPDEIGPATNEARTIFTYNDDNAKPAGIRTETANYKVVIIGAGMEMIPDTSIVNRILKISHDWFYEDISTHTFDAAMDNLIDGVAYPQPALDVVYIPLGTDYQNLRIQLMDINGRMIRDEAVPAGLSRYELTVGDLANGLYFYQLTDGERMSKAQKLMVE
ncbi:MAG: Omp28-related outer membrane protein [Bacteroidota bacterium]